ncbi:MAG: PfkB family carbohydrate kinase [Acidobacteria bacterium]|nr:PfkB family carbohydrate kinase [Acidobacteriota bacterium]
MTKRKEAAEDRARLLRLVDAFPRVTVTVLGDLVADEFVYGEIARVSREAPVLILKHREQTVVPGSGGNAVYNLASLDVQVLPVGVVGEDEPGRMLLEHFRQKRIPSNRITKLKGYGTVTKTRILAGMTHTSRQQVVRIDREPDDPPPAAAVQRLVANASACARTSDALLVSDYGYGAATPEILEAVRAGGRLNSIPITLDSRYRMLDYSGVTAATPNEPEVEAALRTSIGNDQQRLHAAGRTLLKRMKLEQLVITRGRDGMVVFTPGRPPVEIPISGSGQVADVTGAGDTVIATFTAALAAGAASEDAARLANYAGGVVVMKRGTATVSRSELRAAIEQDFRGEG